MKKLFFVLIITFLSLAALPYVSVQLEERVDAIEEEISILKQQNNVAYTQLAVYVAISAVIAVLIGILISDRNTRKSNQTARNSLDSFMKVSEADILLRLTQLVFRSEGSSTILEYAKNIKLKKISDALNIVADKTESDGKWTVTERELENFLNDLEVTLVLIKQGSVTSEMIITEFGWVIDIIVDNQSIMNFVDMRETEFEGTAWPQISAEVKSRKDKSKKNKKKV